MKCCSPRRPGRSPAVRWNPHGAAPRGARHRQSLECHVRAGRQRRVRRSGADPVPTATCSAESANSIGNSLQGRLSAANRARLVGSGGGTLASEDAVAESLKWLSEHQNSDGSWSFAHQQAPHCAGRCGNPGIRARPDRFDGPGTVAVSGCRRNASAGSLQAKRRHGPALFRPGHAPTRRQRQLVGTGRPILRPRPGGHRAVRSLWHDARQFARASRPKVDRLHRRRPGSRRRRLALSSTTRTTRATRRSSAGR